MQLLGHITPLLRKLHWLSVHHDSLQMPAWIGVNNCRAITAIISRRTVRAKNIDGWVVLQSLTNSLPTSLRIAMPVIYLGHALQICTSHHWWRTANNRLGLWCDNTTVSCFQFIVCRCRRYISCKMTADDNMKIMIPINVHLRLWNKTENEFVWL